MIKYIIGHLTLINFHFEYRKNYILDIFIKIVFISVTHILLNVIYFNYTALINFYFGYLFYLFKFF